MKIYKYIGFQKKPRIDYLMRQKRIFHQRPSEFNDPFEMEHRIPITEGVCSILRKELQSKYPAFASEAIDNIISKATATEDFAEVRIKDFIERGQIVEPTVSCFSAEKSLLLMWAHYADSHKGMCIEFDLNALRKCGFNIYEVFYQKELPVVNMDSVWTGDFEKEEIWKSTILTKSKDWDYEKEYRSILFDPKEFLEFDNKCITGIFLGARISDEDELYIKDTISQSGIDCPVIKSKINKYEFKVDC